MLWIVQKNLFNENRRGDLFTALNRLDIPYLEVNILSNNQLDSDIPLDNTLPIITNGSITLSHIAIENNWTPGSFLNDNFSYKVWASHYKELLINKDFTLSCLKDAKMIGDKVFARPILDNKTFTGKVFTKEEFLKFQSDSINLQKGLPNPEVEILISQPKTIGQEHRHYIVDGEIITSSRYKFAGTPNFKEGCDEAVLEVVRSAIKVWQPARAFVMDTYISGNEIGIVEIGCICHAGLYDIDLMKLVVALDSMPLELDNSCKAKFNY